MLNAAKFQTSYLTARQASYGCDIHDYDATKIIAVKANSGTFRVAQMDVVGSVRPTSSDTKTVPDLDL